MKVVKAAQKRNKVSKKRGKTLCELAVWAVDPTVGIDDNESPWVGEIMSRTYAYRPPLTEADMIRDNEDILDYLWRMSHSVVHVRIEPGYGIQGH